MPIKRCNRALLPWLVAALLSSCASVRDSADGVLQIPEFEYRTQHPAADREAADEFLVLDQRMRDFVRDYVPGDGNRIQRLRRLTALMLDPGTLGIVYQADTTLSAKQTFERRTGNCLSFSALLVVLAREAGLDARFQEVPVMPNWRPQGETFLVERHVNALIRIGREQFVVDFRPPATAESSAAREIADEQAIALYFANLGADRLTAGDPAGAYRLFRRGLERDPRSAALWVNIGVALSRNGQNAEAESAYRMALEIESDNLSALGNLAIVLKNTGRESMAARFEARVKHYRRRNPYYLLWLGTRQLDNGDAEAALESFSDALRRAPRLAELHFGMAMAQKSLGRAQAQASLREALRLADSAIERQRFLDAFAISEPESRDD